MLHRKCIGFWKMSKMYGAPLAQTLIVRETLISKNKPNGAGPNGETLISKFHIEMACLTWIMNETWSVRMCTSIVDNVDNSTLIQRLRASAWLWHSLSVYPSSAHLCHGPSLATAQSVTLQIWTQGADPLTSAHLGSCATRLHCKKEQSKLWGDWRVNKEARNIHSLLDSVRFELLYEPKLSLVILLRVPGSTEWF